MTQSPAGLPAVVDREEERRLLVRMFDGLSVFVVGPANVILQLSWPEVGYGVLESKVESGNVMRHPVKRFRTTIGYLGIALYGDDDLRAAYREAVDGAHRFVRSGPDSPVTYNAFHRELQLWVASCMFYGLWDWANRAHGPLSPREERVLLRAASRFGTTLQVPEEMWHASMADFWAYWDAGVQRIRMDEPVADYLRALLRMRMLPFPLDRLAGPLTAWLNTGFLPAPIRGQLDLTWTGRDQRRHDRVVRELGRLLRPLPPVLRLYPINAMMADIERRRRRGRPLV